MRNPARNTAQSAEDGAGAAVQGRVPRASRVGDSSASTADPLSFGVLRLDTPEQVSLRLPLAGLGSRFAALLLDGLLLLCIALAGLIAIFGLGAFADGLWGDGVGRTVLVVVLPAWLFASMWGYFFYFEAFRDGATPGKRRLGLRVVQDGGEALTWRAAALRSLLRIVDLQPGISGLLGGAFMLLHPRAKRLGDLVAGTVVVRDLPHRFPPLPEPGASPAVKRLDDATFEGLARFLQRARGLAPPAREKLLATWVKALALPERAGLGDLLDVVREERDARANEHVVSRGGAASLVRARQTRWIAFQKLVERLSPSRMRRFSDTQAVEFAARLRAVSADLARSRTLGVNAGTRWALERLVARAHALYHRPVGGLGAGFGAYVREGLPRAVRARWREVALASLAFYGSGIVVFALVQGRFEMEPVLVSAGMVDRADLAAANPDFDYRDTFGAAWIGSGGLTSFVLFNNVQVAFLAFAAGALLGLGSLFMMLFNGVILGGVMAAFSNRGVFDNILAWVAPHGPFELTAITLAGAAGLHLGGAVLSPGRLTRGAAFASRAVVSLQILGGAVLLLLLAAPLEGFVAPARVDPTVKHAVGLVCCALLVVYFGWVGRAAEQLSPKPDDLSS